MAKKTLKVIYDYSFLLIGIVSNIKDYRFTWALNNKLSIELSKGEDLELVLSGSTEASWFSRYKYKIPGTETVYFLISNKGNSGYLIPEQRQIDYFLLVEEFQGRVNKESLLKDISNIDFVQSAFIMEANKLKSKENLLF